MVRAAYKRPARPGPVTPSRLRSGHSVVPDTSSNFHRRRGRRMGLPGRTSFDRSSSASPGRPERSPPRSRRPSSASRRPGCRVLRIDGRARRVLRSRWVPPRRPRASPGQPGGTRRENRARMHLARSGTTARRARVHAAHSTRSPSTPQARRPPGEFLLHSSLRPQCSSSVEWRQMRKRPRSNLVSASTERRSRLRVWCRHRTAGGSVTSITLAQGRTCSPFLRVHSPPRRHVSGAPWGPRLSARAA